jgi:hypothetical protein
MCSSPSSLGGGWSSRLEFYNYDEQPKPKIVRLRSSELTIYEKFPNSKKQVVEICRFIHPLHFFQSPLPLSWYQIHHAYIVMRTGHDEVWSFEKNQDGLAVQRGTKWSCVWRIHGNRRTWMFPYPIQRMRVKPGVTVQDVLKWIFDNGELNKPYNLLSDNCQCFANRIMKAIVTYNNTTN